MELGLAGKKAVVCGASSGMGKAIARKLVEENVNVVLIARNKTRLDAAEAELNQIRAGSARSVQFDLSETGKIQDLVGKLLRITGNFHILINNAGGPPPGKVEDLKDDDWQKAIEQNLKSTIWMTRFVLPMMKQQGFGRIINIASQLVKEPPAGMILSNTTRAGVVAFAKSLAQDLAPFGITINTLCPGAIWTDRVRILIEQQAHSDGASVEETMRKVIASLPIKRMGTVEEFANVAVFFSSERAGYLTGVTLAVDGGITKSLL